MGHISGNVSNIFWKRWLRLTVRHGSYYFRARQYFSLCRGSELVHFQQILNAFGSSAVFHWLSRPTGFAKVVTIHEFDFYQQLFANQNGIYNLADALIVHCEQMKQKLLELRIPEEKIHVVLQGADIATLDRTTRRQGFVFYGGHKLMTGKGIESLFNAMAIIKDQMGAATPTLFVHGHYGSETPEGAFKLAQQAGITDTIVWLNQISIEEMKQLYQRSLCLVLPYTGSFAGLAAATAAANELPVICTKNAGIPDHLDKWGLWIEEENPRQLAERMLEVITNAQLRNDVSRGLRRRAEEALSWDVIAERTLDVYRAALAAKCDLKSH